MSRAARGGEGQNACHTNGREWARSGRQPEWLGWFFTVYGLVFVLLPVSLILLNWPKQLVPPRFRHERGMLSEWRGQDGAVSRVD